MRRYSELSKGSLCRGRQDEVFPENGRPKADVKQRLCPVCPVREACLEHALSSPWQPWGMWAGLDQEEVRALWMMRHPGARTADTDAFVGVRPEREDWAS